tara:strand:+ start:304 stop:690 length:387 start_codon:yes stop_codon:yes gene_type:complete
MIKTIISNLLIVTISLLSPLQESMLAIGFLISVDLILGLTASRVNKVKITSLRLKNTCVKMLVYNLLLISSFVCEKFLMPFIPITKISLAFLGTIEITSLGESFQKITGISFIKYVKKYINERLNNTK